MTDNKKTTLNIRCIECNKVFYINVYKKDIELYKKGVLAQSAFPYLTINERELIISNMCGSCFDKIFTEE